MTLCGIVSVFDKIKCTFGTDNIFLSLDKLCLTCVKLCLNKCKFFRKSFMGFFLLSKLFFKRMPYSVYLALSAT